MNVALGNINVTPLKLWFLTVTTFVILEKKMTGMIGIRWHPCPSWEYSGGGFFSCGMIAFVGRRSEMGGQCFPWKLWKVWLMFLNHTHKHTHKRTYLIIFHQPGVDTGCYLEDLPGGKDGRDWWKERDRDRESQGNPYCWWHFMMCIHIFNTTWGYIYIYI